MIEPFVPLKIKIIAIMILDAILLECLYSDYTEGHLNSFTIGCVCGLGFMAHKNIIRIFLRNCFSRSLAVA